MFSKNQCDEARQMTARYDIEDKYINEEFDNLKPEEKEKATQEVWELFEKTNDLPILSLQEIALKYWISEPVLYCLFKAHQAKLRREGKIE